jgi:hypothetical protein
MTYPVNSPNVPQKRGKRSFGTSGLGVRTISLAHKIVVLMPTEGMTDTTAPCPFLVWRRECCWHSGERSLNDETHFRGSLVLLLAGARWLAESVFTVSGAAACSNRELR